jgi:hypothetical protein
MIVHMDQRSRRVTTLCVVSNNTNERKELLLQKVNKYGWFEILIE